MWTEKDKKAISWAPFTQGLYGKGVGKDMASKESGKLGESAVGKLRGSSSRWRE